MHGSVAELQRIRNIRGSNQRRRVELIFHATFHSATARPLSLPPSALAHTRLAGLTRVSERCGRGMIRAEICKISGVSCQGVWAWVCT